MVSLDNSGLFGCYLINDKSTCSLVIHVEIFVFAGSAPLILRSDQGPHMVIPEVFPPEVQGVRIDAGIDGQRVQGRQPQTSCWRTGITKIFRSAGCSILISEDFWSYTVHMYIVVPRPILTHTIHTYQNNADQGFRSPGRFRGGSPEQIC